MQAPDASSSWDQMLKFVFDTAGAQQMMLSIGQMRDELVKQLKVIDDLTAQAKLGDLEEAHVISSINTQVATGDSDSLDRALREFVEVLAEAHQSVKLGMKNYVEVDELAKHGFIRQGR